MNMYFKGKFFVTVHISQSSWNFNYLPHININLYWFNWLGYNPLLSLFILMLTLSQIWPVGKHSCWLHYLCEMSPVLSQPFLALWPKVFQTHLVQLPYFCSGTGHFSRDAGFLLVDNDILNQYLGSRCAHSYWDVNPLGDLTEQI